MKRIIIIMDHDLVNYPPMQSLLTILVELGQEVLYIGVCSDSERKCFFEKMGVEFFDTFCKVYTSPYQIIKENRRYKKKIVELLTRCRVNSKDLIIYEFSSTTAYFLSDVLMPYSYIVLFYEFVNASRSWKYDLIYRSFNMQEFLKRASGLIHCEYNRAHICKGLYSLDKLPYILPNKPYLSDESFDHIPSEIKNQVEDIKVKIQNKKVILYQGIFNSVERRLEDFCQAIYLMPDEYVLLAMGEGTSHYFKNLKQTYESDRVIFLPFIKSPYHLLVTQLAHIGVLTYYPLDNSVAGVLNPLYCAPNKIFEYSKYGIPMVSNDIPGLTLLFKEYNCGKSITYPITPDKVAETILLLFENYQYISDGATRYYNSVDLKFLVKDILKNMNMI